MTGRVRPGPTGDQLLPGGNPELSIRHFCYQHDLHPDFIPVPNRGVSEWDRLQEVTAVIDSLGNYELGFRRNQYLDGIECGDTHLTQTYFWLAGSFPTHYPQAGMNWYNPGYVHGPEHAPKMHDREFHIRNAIELPTVSRNTLAERFGIQPKVLSNWMHANGFAFRASQRKSKQRIGRSILATAEWSDLTVRDCCRILPNVAFSTAKDWAHKYAREDGWTVPGEPVHTKWYL